MPRPNSRSYEDNGRNSRNNYGQPKPTARNYSRNKKDTRATKFGADKFNMLNFGQAFLDEADGRASYEFKARVTLKRKDGELVNVLDGDGKGDNEYTPEESAMLIAKALLEGRAINICFFAQDDGSWSGNARIDIKDIESDEEEEPAPKKTKAAKKTSKPKYEVPEEADEEIEDEITEVDEDDVPY